MNKNLNIRVILFPIGRYERNYLERLTDKKLSELAKKNKCQTWHSLKDFQYAINDDEVDDVNNWIFFLTDVE